MHKYLRAIGFSEVKKRDALQGLINEVVEKTILRRNKTENGKEKNLEEYTSVRDFAADGACVLYFSAAENSGTIENHLKKCHLITIPVYENKKTEFTCEWKAYGFL